MEDLIFKIEIENINEEEKSITYYYITKEEKYGIKILKEIKGNVTGNKILEVKNITENKDQIKRLINILVKSQNDILQLNYIIEDFISNNNQKIIN